MSPRRRTELLAERLAQAQIEWETASHKLEESSQQHRQVLSKLRDTQQLEQQWAQEVLTLSAAYEQQQRQQTAHCQLTRAQHKAATYRQRVPRCAKALEVAERRRTRHEAGYDVAHAEVKRLQAHYQQLVADNAANPYPIQATFRLDAGFTSHEHISWLIEMGYDIYTRGRFTTVREALSAAVMPETAWTQVGSHAYMTGWRKTTVDGYFTYPLDVALLQYRTEDKVQQSTLLHYGQADVVAGADGWFHTYNGRQTIEAGIKEGKNTFQMHHLKVRSLEALRLQEHMACLPPILSAWPLFGWLKRLR